MYASIRETGRIFRGGVLVRGSTTYFSRPSPTASPFANVSMPAPCTEILTAANVYSLLNTLCLGVNHRAG